MQTTTKKQKRFENKRYSIMKFEIAPYFHISSIIIIFKMLTLYNKRLYTIGTYVYI